VGDATKRVAELLRPGKRARVRLLAAVSSASALALLSSGTASAQQSYTWGGTGSTTTTSDYNTATNWSNSTTAPPNFPTQSAIFGATGSKFITVNGLSPPPEAFPDSWTFQADSQSYRIHGVDVDFSLGGSTGGIINNANEGQTIRIFNNINDGFGGPIEVQQLGNSTLVLGGANGYSGGTMLSAGTVRITNANSLGDATGIVTFNGGTLQGNGKGIAIGVVNPMQITGNGGTIDANTDALNFSGNITDGAGAHGALTVADSSGSSFGVVELSGTNSYSGGTTISNLVTLRADNTSAVGSGTVTLNGGAFQAGADGLVFNNAFVATT
jgi:autotransporter-associated beta strand protein